MSKQVQIPEHKSISSRVSQHLEELFERQQFDFFDPLAKLLSGIDMAFSGESSDQSELRERYVGALDSIYRFLLPVDAVHADRFLMLKEAIADLNAGLRPPIFSPAKKTNGKITAPAIRRARAGVVCALELLIKRVNMSKKAAAERVLKKFPGIKHLAGPKSLNQSSSGAWPQTILRWRTDLNARSRPTDVVAKDRFRIGEEVFWGADAIADYRKLRKEAFSAPEFFTQVADEILRDAERVGKFVAHSQA